MAIDLPVRFSQMLWQCYSSKDCDWRWIGLLKEGKVDQKTSLENSNFRFAGLNTSTHTVTRVNANKWMDENEMAMRESSPLLSAQAE